MLKHGTHDKVEHKYTTASCHLKTAPFAMKQEHNLICCAVLCA